MAPVYKEKQAGTQAVVIDCRSGLQSGPEMEHIFSMIDGARKPASPLIPGLNQEHSWMIEIVRSPRLSDVQEQLNYMSETPGLDAGGLRLVQTSSGSWAAVKNAGENLREAQRTYYDWSEKLIEAGFGKPSWASSMEYKALYSIVLKEDSSFLRLQRSYRELSCLCPPEFMDKVQIQRFGYAHFALVYNDLLTLKNAKNELAGRGAALREFGFAPALADLQSRPVLFSSADYRSEEEEAAVRPGSMDRSADLRSLRSAASLIVENHKKRGLLDHGVEGSFVIYDLVSEEKLLSVNEDVLLQSASMMKAFVAQAFFIEVEAGRQSYTPRMRRLMEKMIRDSDNVSTNTLMRKMRGPQEVERILQARSKGIFSDVQIVEYIPAKDDPSVPEEEYGRTYLNKAPARSYSRFLYALYHDRLPYSDELKRIMSLPHQGREDFDRIRVKAGIPESVTAQNKTGTTGQLCGDMGILTARGADGRYYSWLVVGILQSDKRQVDWQSWASRAGNVIGEISALGYREMQVRYGIE